MRYVLILFGLGFVGFGLWGAFHGQLDGIPIVVAGLLAFFVLWATRARRTTGGEGGQ